MRTLHLKILLRAALLVAIVASTALLVDYQSTAGPSFCGVGTGCAQVRESAFSHIFGIPLPIFGLAGFGVLFVGAVWSRSRAHQRLLAMACGAAALGALGLIGLMVFKIKAVCPWCMGVDVGALVACGVALALWGREPEPEPAGQRALWTATAIAASVITLLWGRNPEYKPPPEDVAKLQVPNRVTLVVFTDFECPFCQALHPVIDQLAEEHQPLVAVRLVMVPLSIHPAADPTARAYLCADEDKQKALAHALYGLNYDQLLNDSARQAAATAGVSLEALGKRMNDGDQAAVEAVKKALERTVTQAALDEASKLGIDASKIQACMNDPQTRHRLDEQIEMFKRAKLEGLPSTFVGNYLVQGADDRMLRAAVDAAIAGGGLSVRWMFAIIAGLLVAVSAISLTSRPPVPPAAPKGDEPSERGDGSEGDEEPSAKPAKAGRRRNSIRPAGAKRKARSSRRPPPADEPPASGDDPPVEA